MISAWRRGLFCALGDGDVDLAGFCAELSERIRRVGGDRAGPRARGQRRVRPRGAGAARQPRVAQGARRMVTAFDVITMGRIGVDIYPLQTGVSLRHVESFGKYLGGSSSNVAVAAARYGHKVATITRTGDGPLRRVPARRAAGLRRRRPLRDRGRPPPHAGHVLRDLPARRLPAVLLPRAQGARPRDPRARARPRRDQAGQGLLGHGHRPQPGAEPLRHARRAGGGRGHHGARPRLAPDVLGQPRGGAQVGARGDQARERRRRQRGRMAHGGLRAR